MSEVVWKLLDFIDFQPHVTLVEVQFQFWPGPKPAGELAGTLGIICTSKQCLNQDVEFWVTKIGHFEIFGSPIFQGRPLYAQMTTINIYSLMK